MSWALIWALAILIIVICDGDPRVANGENCAQQPRIGQCVQLMYHRVRMTTLPVSVLHRLASELSAYCEGALVTAAKFSPNGYLLATAAWHDSIHLR